MVPQGVRNQPRVVWSVTTATSHSHAPHSSCDGHQGTGGWPPPHPGHGLPSSNQVLTGAESNSQVQLSRVLGVGRPRR